MWPRCCSVNHVWYFNYLFQVSKTCVKCASSKAVVLVRQSSYCKFDFDILLIDRICFMNQFVRKFRSNLWKVDDLRHGVISCLIPFSGGPSSRLSWWRGWLSWLEHCWPSSTNSSSHINTNQECWIRLLFFISTNPWPRERPSRYLSSRPIHVDLNWKAEYLKSLELLYPYKWVRCGIDMAYESETTSVQGFVCLGLNVILKGFASLICVMRLKRTTRQIARLFCAVENVVVQGGFVVSFEDGADAASRSSIQVFIQGREEVDGVCCSCGHILLGDSSTRLAIRTLSFFSKGRGMNLSNDVCFENRSNDGTSVDDGWVDFTVARCRNYNLEANEGYFVKGNCILQPIHASWYLCGHRFHHRHDIACKHRSTHRRF